MKHHDLQWFTTDEAKTEAESSFQSRVKIIYEYLTTLNQYNDPKLLLKLAYVMADSMHSSDQKFAGWPNIIDEQYNPLLAIVEAGKLQAADDKGTVTYNDIVATGLKTHIVSLLISALQGQELHIVKYFELHSFEENEDLYAIEKEIVWLFSDTEKEFYSVGPYSFFKEKISTPENDLKQLQTETETLELLNQKLDHEKTRRMIKVDRKIEEAEEKAASRKKTRKILLIIAAVIAVLSIVFSIQDAKDKKAYQNNYGSNNIDISVDGKSISFSNSYNVIFDFPMTITNDCKQDLTNIAGKMLIYSNDNALIMDINVNMKVNVQSGTTGSAKMQVQAQNNQYATQLYYANNEDLVIYFTINSLGFADGTGVKNLQDERILYFLSDPQGTQQDQGEQYEPAQEPAVEPVEDPSYEPSDNPVEDPTYDSAEQTPDGPADEPIESPTDETSGESSDEISDEPIDESLVIRPSRKNSSSALKAVEEYADWIEDYMLSKYPNCYKFSSGCGYHWVITTTVRDDTWTGSCILWENNYEWSIYDFECTYVDDEFHINDVYREIDN